MQPFCFYGCAQPAVKQYKNGRWCCSDSVNRCPAKIEADRLKKKGRNPFENRPHPRGKKGKPSWNSGKKLPPEFGQKVRAGQLAAGTKFTGRAHSEEAEQERRRKISATMKRNPLAGGRREGSGVGKKTWYESKCCGRVLLDSTYELAYARYLDESNILWIRNKKQFAYLWAGEAHYYIPDFYLPNQDLYVEIKGFRTDKDVAKWEWFPYNLIVLYEKDLNDLNIL